MSAAQDMWSRRRAAVLAEAEAEDRAVVAAAEAQERARLEDKSDAEILAELDLKDPDDLEAGDDFAGFRLAKKVMLGPPARLGRTNRWPKLCCPKMACCPKMMKRMKFR